jgi:hypothetical protein
MHERNIARPRMPICRVIKILDHIVETNRHGQNWPTPGAPSHLIPGIFTWHKVGLVILSAANVVHAQFSEYTACGNDLTEKGPWLAKHGIHSL